MKIPKTLLITGTVANLFNEQRQSYDYFYSLTLFGQSTSTPELTCIGSIQGWFDSMSKVELAARDKYCYFFNESPFDIISMDSIKRI